MVQALSTFTLIHVAICLIAILSGLVVLFGLIDNKRMNGMTALYLFFTAATSVTGFFFPFHGVTPAIILGIISCVVLVPTLLARYQFGMRGVWRPVYVIGAVLLLYLNCFVLVVQSFQKVPALHTLDPTQSGAPFLVAQGLTLVFFVVTGWMATKRFRAM
ncbi:MAG TPA: hypothetical protein VGG48_04850 [Rhizomicrobium sp.]|jgi:hypothetical protein